MRSFMLALVILVAVCLVILSSGATAQHLSPNPNPSGNTITISSSTSLSNDFSFNDPFLNNGAIEIDSDGVLFMNSASGRLISSGWFDISGRLQNFGHFENAAGGILSNYPGGIIQNLLVLENHGVLNNRQGVISFFSEGTANNYGTMNNYCVGGPVGDKKFSQINNYGTLNNYGGVYNRGVITNVWPGTLINHQGATFENRSDDSGRYCGFFLNLNKVENFGTFKNAKTFDNPGTFVNHSTLTNESGGTFSNYGTLDTTGGTFNNFGTLSGSGTIVGNHTDHGAIKPGNSAGVMTIDGDLVKVEGSKEIELGGLFDGDGDNSLTEYDWLDVKGNVELAGTLHVVLIDDFRLSEGMSFNILRVEGTLMGQYDGLGEGDLVGQFGGKQLFITYSGGGGSDVVLFTDVVPEPVIVNVSPRCEAAIDKAAGRYSQCLLKASAKFAKKGNEDRLFAQQMRCGDKFDAQVARAQDRYGEDQCTPYVSEIADHIMSSAEDVSSAAGGSETLVGTTAWSN